MAKNNAKGVNKKPVDNGRDFSKVTGGFVEDMSLSTVHTIRSFEPTTYQKAEDLDIFNKMKMAGSYHTTDNVVQNCFTSQISMAFNSIEHKTKGDKNDIVKNFYDYIAHRLNILSYLRMFYLGALIYANMYMVQYWEEVEVPWGAKSTRMMKIPTGIALIDPRYGRVLGSTLNYNKKVGMRVSNKTMHDYTEENLKEANKGWVIKPFKGIWTPKNRYNYRKDNGLETGDKILELNPKVSSHYKFRGQDYQRYAVPVLANCFDWVQRKKKLMEADMAVIDGIINMIYLFTIGTDELPAEGEDGKRELGNLYNKIANTSRTCTLVWNHRLNVSVVSPEPEALLDTDKYQICNDNIREGLGFEFKNTMSRGRRDIDKLVKIFCEVIMSDRRDIIHHFETEIYDNIAEVNSLPASAKIKPNRIGVAIDDLLKAFVGLFYDRGLVSKQSAMEIMELDYGEEKELKEGEKQDIKDGVWNIPELPFSRPQTGGSKDNKPNEGTPSQADLIKNITMNQYMRVTDELCKDPEVHAVIKNALGKRLEDEEPETATKKKPKEKPNKKGK